MYRTFCNLLFTKIFSDTGRVFVFDLFTSYDERVYNVLLIYKELLIKCLFLEVKA